MFMSRQQNLGQGHNLLTANKSIENVTKFKYFGRKTQNHVHEQSKSKLSAERLAAFHFRIFVFMSRL
jgi:hypothetical protein